jgi:uncharacterized membrane protein
MGRQIVGTIAGIIAWLVIVTVLNRVLRYSWSDYAAVETAMTFTVPMMIARLAISGISSILSGAVATFIGRERVKPSLGAGVVLLVVFIPFHYMLWHRFPVWYHLTFLASLVLLSLLGGRLVRTRRMIFQTA